MAVGGGLRLFQMLRVVEKSLAQPVPRCGKICTVVYNLARLRLQCVSVCPVARCGRRVERQERHGELSAAQRGLLDVADLRFAGELVGFFKPVDADVAERQLDGFELFRLVQTEKKDLLTCGQIGNLHRRNCTTELVLQPQRADGPLDLRVHAVAQCHGDFAQHHAMTLRMLQKEQDELHAHKTGFCTATATLAYDGMWPLRLDLRVQLVECGGHAFT